MNHESWKTDQKGEADAGASSGADETRRRPSGEAAGDESASAARTSSDELEGVLGYRLWRLRDGELYSQTNDTVWPRGHALQARAGMSLKDWASQLGWPDAFILVAMWAIMAVMTSMMLWLVASTGQDAQWLETPMAKVVALLVSLGLTATTAGAFLPGVGSMYRLLLWRVTAGLFGHVVAPGSNTPGIYAMRRLADVSGGMPATEPGQIVVRGSVCIWGDSIDHEYGVKGEFAYPDTIVDVQCGRCPDWIPLDEYADESEPPMHSECLLWRAPARWEFGNETWGAAGLSKLRYSAPQWFGAP